MNGGERAPDGGRSAAGATFAELAEQLETLRRHVGRMVADLETPRRNGRGLRCADCGRVDSADADGWTLRLCPDDELHHFCPDCDERHFAAARRKSS